MIIIQPITLSAVPGCKRRYLTICDKALNLVFKTVVRVWYKALSIT
jgi:hypothetical protein